MQKKVVLASDLCQKVVFCVTIRVWRVLRKGACRMHTPVLSYLFLEILSSSFLSCFLPLFRKKKMGLHITNSITIAVMNTPMFIFMFC